MPSETIILIALAAMGFFLPFLPDRRLERLEPRLERLEPRLDRRLDTLTFMPFDFLERLRLPNEKVI